MNTYLKKSLCVLTAFTTLCFTVQADAGILFGEGGLFQQMRMNRQARISQRAAASYGTTYSTVGASYNNSYSSSGGTGEYEVTSVRYTESQGSTGGSPSFGSTGSTGSYRSAPRMFNRPVFRTRSGCFIDPMTGNKVCPTSSIKVKAPNVESGTLNKDDETQYASGKCNNPNCSCVDCKCENCVDGCCELKTSLVGIKAPDVAVPTSLVGKEAPIVHEAVSYASL